MKNTIKVERAKKNWTQAELAKNIGISRQGLNSIETGKFIPSTVLALRMAKVFDTTVEILFQLDDMEGWWNEEPKLNFIIKNSEEGEINFIDLLWERLK